MPASPEDGWLLAARRGDEAAFSRLYRCYERPLAAFFLRSTGNAELAADLTAETFATVVVHLKRFDPAKGSAGAWMYGIARNVLGRSLQRGRVEDRARRRLGVPRLELDDVLVGEIEALEADDWASSLLGRLPAEQGEAVHARVVEGRPYSEIAAALQCSESVVRKRVSRGLARLKSVMREDT